MIANVNPSRPKRLCTIKNGVDGGRKMQCRRKKGTNVISRLNDFCLLEIFNRLELKDLFNLTDLNKQFKRVSEISFAGRYAKFVYRTVGWHHESTRSEMRRVLCKFGKSIKSMSYQGYNSKNVDLIPKFCAGGTLDELHLSTRTMMKNDDCARLLFSSLKTLTFNNYCRINGCAGALFSKCQELKTLRLKNIASRKGLKCNVAQKYPKLEELYIDNVNFRTTKPLLQLNQQIKKLDMPGIYATTFAVVSTMVHLEELVIRDCGEKVVNCYKYIAKLADLKSLKLLALHNVCFQFVTAIVEAMKNVHSLSRFECTGNYRDWQITNQIKKLKRLKSLALIFPWLPFDDCFAELAKQFPLLHELKVEFDVRQSYPTRLIGIIIRFIELSTTLEILKIRTSEPEIFNQHFYDELLKVIQKRQSCKTFKVTVYYFNSISITLNNIQCYSVNMHSNLLQVEFNRVNDREYVI